MAHGYLPSQGETPLSEVMIRDVVAVPPDMSLSDVTSLLLDRRISGAPVVDDRRVPIGILSKTDLLTRVHAGPLGGTARDIMRPLTFVLPQSETLSRAAALMAFEGVHRIVVLAPDGTLGGIVSSLDIVRWLARRDGYVVR